MDCPVCDDEVDGCDQCGDYPVTMCLQGGLLHCCSDCNEINGEMLASSGYEIEDEGE